MPLQIKEYLTVGSTPITAIWQLLLPKLLLPKELSNQTSASEASTSARSLTRTATDGSYSSRPTTRPNISGSDGAQSLFPASWMFGISTEPPFAVPVLHGNLHFFFIRLIAELHSVQVQFLDLFLLQGVNEKSEPRKKRRVYITGSDDEDWTLKCTVLFSLWF